MRPSAAYKVLTEAQMKALETGAFTGAPVDLADGYIHLSTANQLAGTIDNTVIAAAHAARLKLPNRIIRSRI